MKRSKCLFLKGIKLLLVILLLFCLSTCKINNDPSNDNNSNNNMASNANTNANQNPLPSGGAWGGSADVNEDGVVDVADISSIISIMAESN